MTVDRATSRVPAKVRSAPRADTVDTASSVHSGSAVNADHSEPGELRGGRSPLRTKEGRMAAQVTVYSNVG